EEASQELERVDGTVLDAIGVGVIAPRERNVVIRKRFDAVVADRHPMCVPRQILEYLPGTTEGPLCIGDPLLCRGALYEQMRRYRRWKPIELAAPFGLTKRRDEQRAEAAPQHLDRKQIRGLADGDPPAPVSRKSASWHHTM